MNALATWIKENTTQAQLARDLGITQSTICLILKGKRSPSPNLARRISRTTGIPLETVLFEDGDE